MSADSKIEWTDATWNPVIGCTKVSPGCDHCYAIRTAHRMSANPNAKIAAAYGGTEQGGEWTGQVNLLGDRLDQPLRWAKPKRIFVNSQADLFHDQVPDRFIADVFAIMALAPRHTFQVLTKRHGRMRSLLSSPGWTPMVDDAAAIIAESYDLPIEHVFPLPNVWLGVSVENQQWADIRIPALLETPAAVRFLSCEPLLGPVDLVAQGRKGVYALPDPAQYDGGEPVCQDHGVERCWQGCTFVDWVIVGGESGPGARPMHPEWARSLLEQCQAAGVPFLFKQWGEWGHAEGERRDGDLRLHPLDGDTRFHYLMRRVGKKAAGRLLGGRTWDEYPAAVNA